MVAQIQIKLVYPAWKECQAEHDETHPKANTVQGVEHAFVFHGAEDQKHVQEDCCDFAAPVEARKPVHSEGDKTSTIADDRHDMMDCHEDLIHKFEVSQKHLGKRHHLPYDVQPQK